MRSQAIFFAAFLLFSLLSFGCGGESPNANANAANGASNNPLETKAPATNQTANAAPTLTPVFKAYCEAWVNNDEAGLRKSYSKDTIKLFEEQMKEDKIKSLIKFLETDRVSGKLCEVRNETITGDTAVAEIRSEVYPSGLKIVFVKEGDEWKMTNRSPNSITQSEANATSAKPAEPTDNTSNDNKAKTKKAN